MTEPRKHMSLSHHRGGIPESPMDSPSCKGSSLPRDLRLPPSRWCGVKATTLKRAVAGLVLCLLVIGVSRRSGAQGHPNLAKARQEYMNQDHAKVVELVRPLVEPRSLLSSEIEEAEAYELLGVSYWWLNKFKAAEASFLVLLSLRPKKTLNPAVHAAGVIKFFQRIKKKLKRKPQEIKERQIKEFQACRKKIKKQNLRIKKLEDSAVIRTVVKRPMWMSFIPFGVGQFNNGDTTRGWIFFSVEAALLLANLTSYILAETPWVRNGPGGSVKDDDASIRRARNIQIAEITTGSLLIGVAAAGIIEALVSYKSRTVRTRRVFPRREEKAAAKKAEGSRGVWKSLRMRPTLLPGGGGLNVALEF